jgi:predicted nucleic acid-binding protein
LAILLDTGIFYALYDTRDSNHDSGFGIVGHALIGRWGRAFLSNYIALETTLLLNSKMGAGLSRAFLEFVDESGITELVVDDSLHRQARALFRDDNKLSLTDSASVALMRSLGIEWLATFDERSFRKYSKSIVGPAYWESLDEEERKKLQKTKSF